MQRLTSLAMDLGKNDEEKDLLAMLLDDFYQENFHPPILFPPDKPTEKQRGQMKIGSSGQNKWSKGSNKKPGNN
jgi:hypothetical protein